MRQSIRRSRVKGDATIDAQTASIVMKASPAFLCPGVLEYPVAHRLQCNRGDSLFDLTVFARRTGRAGLEEVVERWQFLERDVLISALLQRLFDGGQV